MATTTTRLKLTLPDVSEPADINVLNDNFSLIDAWIKTSALGHTGAWNIDTLDNAKTFGLHLSNVGTPNAVYWVCLALPHNENNVLQIAYRSTMNPPWVCIRRYTSGVWSEWEYLTPPMAPGTEYPTTERSNGKTVYKKRIVYTTTDIGTAGSVTSVSIPHGIASFGELVSVDAHMGTYALPIMDSTGNITLVNTVNATNIVLRTNGAWGGDRTWTIDLAYTKA